MSDTAVSEERLVAHELSEPVGLGRAVPRVLAPRNEPLSSSAIDSETPWTSSRFWVLQVVILALSMIRLAATLSFHLASSSVALEFSTLALFVIPVLVAAFNYGLAGAVFTAGWVTLLSIPRFVGDLNVHNGVGAWAEVGQVALLDALAFLVGQRVTAERHARQLAESAERAHLSAEALYRDLFDSNQSPILLVDDSGNVIEANASAQRAFGHDSANIDGPPSASLDAPVRLVDMIGASAAGQVLSRLITEQTERIHRTDANDQLVRGTQRITPVTVEIDGRPTLFRPTATMLTPSETGARMQVVFEDVTAETRRHELTEAYAARVVLGQEEERRHIAQELHDGPVQTLIHLCRQMDGLASQGGRVPGGSPAISDLRVIVEDAVAELRVIAKGLRPSVLDDLGLVASINQLVSETRDRQHLEAIFTITGTEKRLSPAVELALFRITQEALSNIERHAAATRVDVTLDFEERGLRLLVADNGVGFPTGGEIDTVDSESLGLRGMSERARLIGSHLSVRSGPGTGTTIGAFVSTTNIEFS